MKRINGIIPIKRTLPIITTRNVRRKELPNKTLQMLFVLIITCLLLTPIGGCSNVKIEDRVRHISFSPDGKKIIFNRRKAEGPNLINVYDLESGELSAYQSPSNETWTMAGYSFDGKYIVFSITPRGEKYLELEKMQIAVMDPEGKNVRRITNGSGAKIYPSFSHSGKKVIFVKAGRIRERGKTPAADYDIYEVDIETGQETRLTWFKFFMMSPPYYFPDDETIIFSAYGPPSIYPGIAEDDYEAIRKKAEELKEKSIQGFGKRGTANWIPSIHDNIYVMKKGEKELPEPLIRSKDDMRSPTLTYAGKIFFEAPAYKPDGSGDWSQIFEYSPDDNHRRITNIQGRGIKSWAVSPDGEMLAVVFSGEIMEISVYRVKDGSVQEISLPDQPLRIINGTEQNRID